MKWSQKVSLAGGIGIASSSLLLGVGFGEAASTPSTKRNDGDKNVNNAGILQTLKDGLYSRQLHTTSMAAGGGIAYIVAARLFKRVKPFRLYAAAAALMLAVVPYNFLLLYRTPVGHSDATGQSGRRRTRLAYIRASMAALAAMLALTAKATS